MRPGTSRAPFLAQSLHLEELYDREDIPPVDDPNYPDFLWETLLEESREDGTLRSFFVVSRKRESVRQNLFVTPDWTTAEAFASRI